MIFQGDISTYHPSDALMFLAQLGLSGILSVASGKQILTLSFHTGRLLDAQSAAGDEKLLQILRFQKQIDQEQENKIRQAGSETGLAVRQLLPKMVPIPLSQIKPFLEMSTMEVLLELFLLEKGQFHFTDTKVETDQAGIELDTGALAIMALSHADEFRNFEKTIISIDRGITATKNFDRATALPVEARALIHLSAKEGGTVRQLISAAPFYRHQAMQHLEKLINDGTLTLVPLGKADSQTASFPASQIDPLFGAFRQTFKTLMGVTDVLKRVEAVIGFCKNFYDGILILTAREGTIIHVKQITIEHRRNIRQQTLKEKIGTICQDPVFQAVHNGGIGFFGHIFPSPLIERVVSLPATGECALIPIVNKKQLSIFFYAYAAGTFQKKVSPHHYLELLSWLITPTSKPAKAPAPVLTEPVEATPAEGADAIDLVAGIDELPPLPAMANKALEQLSDPNGSLELVEKTIAQDQALVAKLIKVSNSALYGGYQKVASLRQALARLGAKTIKSLVLSASARSYFYRSSKGLKTWGPILWQHSVESGLAARRIASVCFYKDPEQAFIGGIMHDIGKLIILMADDQKYQEIQRKIMSERVEDQVAEIEILGASHTDLGRRLMDKWHMPEEVHVCAQHHHTPDQAGEYSELVAIVAYANLLSHAFGNRPHPDLLEENSLVPELLKMLNISPSQNIKLLKLVRSDFQNTELME